jgi:serine/threonine-protein kinase
VIAGFTLESVLGEGGMATVFRARQTEPNRLVALKVIRADHAADETYRKRFLAEKETLAALEHPSIVPIYAAGAADGVLYIAMRLVAGPDLQARIAAESRLSLRETVEILQPIADAVDYAHAAGIIHRDLKPSNIILDSAARPYLTDFGLGKRVEVETDLSAPGLTIGTLDYMAPEQFDSAGGAKPGPEIDIYALGCVAYQCLTGKPPFVRDTPQQLMYAHVHEAPPAVHAAQPEYPPELDTVFAKVLAKDPGARFASATEFVAALDAVVTTAAASQTRPVVIASQGSLERVRQWLGANTALAVGGGAIAVVLAVILGAAFVFKPPAPSPGPTQVARATTKPGPTAGPTAAAPLTASEESLRSRLPILAIDTTKCTTWPTPPGGADVLSPSGYAASTARITCPGPAGSDSSVQYAMYASKADLGADYDAIMAGLGVVRGGACKAAIPADSPWQHGSTGEAGVLACFQRNGRVQYVWTDYERRTLAQWLAPDNAAGLAFWQSWTQAFNAAETSLLGELPPSVDGAANCVRADDLYWESALAALSCPRAAGGNPVFYGGFAAADAFPNDPMTTQFAALMNTYGGFATDTKTGCLDKDASGVSAPEYGRYVWVYGTGATEGYIGCYARTDTNPATSQLIWTFNRTAVMGLWTAPDLPSAVTLFSDWTAAVR